MRNFSLACFERAFFNELLLFNVKYTNLRRFCRVVASLLSSPFAKKGHSKDLSVPVVNVNIITKTGLLFQTKQRKNEDEVNTFDLGKV